MISCLIIQRTSFAHRCKHYLSECRHFYSTKTPCHPQVKDLNCFLCPCPNYVSESLEGGCKINSSRGKFTYNKDLPAGRVWDCTDCFLEPTLQEVGAYI